MYLTQGWSQGGFGGLTPPEIAGTKNNVSDLQMYY